jgi:predicted nucleotidyltransferase
LGVRVSPSDRAKLDSKTNFPYKRNSTMDKREVINIVKANRQLLEKHLKFESIYLYGSFAIGTNKKDSDIDVAIVVDHVDGDFFAVNPLLWKLRREIDDRIEPVLIEKEFDDAGFLNEIYKTGIEIK